MTIAERVEDGIVTLEIHGRLTCETLEPFHLAVARHLAEGSRGFVIDLLNVDYIDSEGLGSMIQAYTSCRRRGTPIVFAHVFGKNLQLLKTTKLLTVFEIYNTRVEAERAAASMTSAAFSATI
jgi:anti-sigma B factor antagonist